MRDLWPSFLVAAISGVVTFVSLAAVGEHQGRPASSKSPPTMEADDFSRLTVSHPTLFRFGGTARRHDAANEVTHEYVLIQQWSGRAHNGVSLYDEVFAERVPGLHTDADYIEKRDKLVDEIRERIDKLNRRAELWRVTATDPVRIAPDKEGQ